MSITSNPYAGFGGIVYGENFVGRTDIIETIRARVLTADPGCLSLVGPPRIGKSSVAYQALIHERSLAYEHRVIPVWIGMGAFTSSQDFFAKLLMTAKEELEDIGAYTDQMQRYASVALQPTCAWLDFNHNMQQFFRRVRASGWRLVFVVDEFDAATTVFGNSSVAFQAMRELHNSPEWRVAFVTTSRRTIKEIEAHAGISNLQGIFPSHSVALFSRQEVQDFLEDLPGLGLRLAEDHIDSILRNVGAHPYLLANVAFHLAGLWIARKIIDLDQAFALSASAFERYFERLVDLFREDGILPSLLAVATGRQSQVSSSDINRLLEYGVIQLTGANRFEIFSRLFQNHLVRMQQAANSNTLLEKGMLVGHKYRVLTTPRITAHSQLVKAWDEVLERSVAIKCIYTSAKDTDATTEFSAILKREGQILAQLSHPNIGVIYEILLEPLATVMEWIEGESLREVIDQELAESRPQLSYAEISHIGIQLADALSYIHEHPQGIVHRDIKPSNIIRKNSGVPILIDFDIARAQSQNTLTGNSERSISQIGTGDFSAPEQLRSAASVGPAADIFSLGVVLYELCTHVLPFRHGNDPRHYGGQLPVPQRLNIPDPLYEIIRACLQEKPELRPTAIQLKQQLEKFPC